MQRAAKFAVLTLAAATLGMGFSSTALADEKEPIRITGTATDRDISCNGKSVNISGAAHNIRLNGCNKVRVSGSGNNVWVRSSGHVLVSGAGNNVEARFTYDGFVKISGSGNDVTVIAPKDIKVPVTKTGLENKVSRQHP